MTGTPHAAGEQAGEQTVWLELVDETGAAIGRAGKLTAHQAPGALHRAFSVFLIDPEGSLLMTRRAASKYHFASAWTNTCCGHPAPGAQPAAAAHQRLIDELGLVPPPLTAAGTVTYTVTDPVSGLVEKEFDHVFAGIHDGPLHPDPDEVADCALVSPAQLGPWRAGRSVTGWFDFALAAARPVLRDLAPEAGW